MRLKTGVIWKERQFAVAGRIGLDSTERNCNLVAVEDSWGLVDNLPAYRTELHTQPERLHTRYSLAGGDDSRLVAAAEGYCWFAKPRDGAREEC